MSFRRWLHKSVSNHDMVKTAWNSYGVLFDAYMQCNILFDITVPFPNISVLIDIIDSVSQIHHEAA